MYLYDYEVGREKTIDVRPQFIQIYEKTLYFDNDLLSFVFCTSFATQWRRGGCSHVATPLNLDILEDIQ